MLKPAGRSAMWFWISRRARRDQDGGGGEGATFNMTVILNLFQNPPSGVALS